MVDTVVGIMELGSLGAHSQNHRVSCLVGTQDLWLCQRLRYDYFVGRNRWVIPDPSQPCLETDQYDPHAWHLAVFEEAGADDTFKRSGSPPAPVGGVGDAVRVLAYLRVLPWTAPIGFMLDHDFACLVSEEERERLPRVNAVELSRLVVAPGACRGGGRDTGSGGKSPHVVKLLLKLLYHLSLQEGIEHYYIVVEKDWLPAFTRRFHIPFRVIGREHTFPDGTRTVAAYAARSELEEAVAAKDPEKYAWYQRLEAARP